VLCELRYEFKAEPAGTYWYHAHTGMQFTDGLRGPLIVKVSPLLLQMHMQQLLLSTDNTTVPIFS